MQSGFFYAFDRLLKLPYRSLKSSGDAVKCLPFYHPTTQLFTALTMIFTHNKLRLLLYACSMCLLFLSASGQDNIVEDVVHPAPNAAALGKYGDIPVSYHTGLPNISLPVPVSYTHLTLPTIA